MPNAITSRKKKKKKKVVEEEEEEEMGAIAWAPFLVLWSFITSLNAPTLQWYSLPFSPTDRAPSTSTSTQHHHLSSSFLLLLLLQSRLMNLLLLLLLLLLWSPLSSLFSFQQLLGLVCFCLQRTTTTTAIIISFSSSSSSSSSSSIGAVSIKLVYHKNSKVECLNYKAVRDLAAQLNHSAQRAFAVVPQTKNWSEKFSLRFQNEGVCLFNFHSFV